MRLTCRSSSFLSLGLQNQSQQSKWAVFRKQRLQWQLMMQRSLFQPPRSLQYHLLVFAEGEPDILFPQMRIFSIIEGRNRYAYNFVLVDQLIGKGPILGPLVSVFIRQVFLQDLYLRNISKDEVASFGDPQIEIIRRIQQLFYQQIPMIRQFACQFLQIAVFRLSNFRKAVSHSVLDHIVLAEDVILMNRPYGSDKAGRPNDPAAANSSCCKDFASRVNTQSAVGHAFLKGYFRQRFIIHIVEGYAFVDVVLDSHDLRVLLQDFGQFGQLFIGEDFSHGVVRAVDENDSCFLVQRFLKSLKIDVPLISFIGKHSVLDFGEKLGLTLLYHEKSTLYLGIKGIPMLLPPAICTCGRQQSQEGSNRITSSPGLTNPIIAQQRPQTPPCTTHMSFSWSSSPKAFLWKSAIALVQVREPKARTYWWLLPDWAQFRYLRQKSGGCQEGKPCPRLTD